LDHMTILTCKEDQKSSLDDDLSAENTKFLKRLNVVQESMNLLMNVMRKEMSEHEEKMSKLLGQKVDQKNVNDKKKVHYYRY